VSQSRLGVHINVETSPPMPALRLIRPPPSAGPTDAELIGSIRAGDRQAAEVLFRRHHAMVSGLAFRLLAGDADVDDVVQDAFVEALRSLSRLDNPQAFGSWIASIVVRIGAKKLRRRRLLEKLGLRRREAIDVDAFLSPSCPGDIASELRAVYRALAGLSAEARIALILRRVEGLTIEETADRMHLSTATVKRRVADAEAHLIEWRTVDT
jgi:RNA polymerase sigma-70 factor (ECF subfamily)